MLTVRTGLRINQRAFDGIPMNFTRDQISALTVSQVEPGSVRIGDETVRENVVIFRDEIQHGMGIDNIEGLHERDLEFLLSKQPEIVIVGSGWQSRRPPRDLVFAMARRGIGFESMDTPAACRTFNILVSEGRDVAAILIIVD